MENNFESRYALGPEEVKGMNTTQLRKNFLIENIFEADVVKITLSFYDRYITGGVMPVKGSVTLPNPENSGSNTDSYQFAHSAIPFILPCKATFQHRRTLFNDG